MGLASKEDPKGTARASEGQARGSVAAIAAKPYSGRESFVYFRYAYLGAAILLVLTIGLSISVLAGYLSKQVGLYRPQAGGAGTHPLTFLSVLSIAIALIIARPMDRLPALSRGLLGLALAISMLRIAEIALLGAGNGPVSLVLDGLVNDSWTATRPITMGFNTALVILLISTSQLLRRHRPGVALLLASLAPFVPLTSLVGYSLGLQTFSGEMSTLSTVMTLALSLAGLTSFLHRRVMQPALARSTHGRMMRIQLLFSLAFPWLIGRFLVQSAGHDTQVTEAAFTTIIMWFVASMVMLSGEAHARTDQARQRSEAALGKVASTDRLTGILNRQGLYDAFWNRQISAGGAGIVLLDLDEFKRVNDTYGHSAGDTVLIRATLAMRAELRSADLLARWGGEEFLFVLPGLNMAKTQVFAEHVRHALRAIEGPSGALCEVTGSFGVTTLAPGEVTLDAALNRADRALYRAKECGRDRVIAELPMRSATEISQPVQYGTGIGRPGVRLN